MADLADDQWIVDFTADGEWAATRRAFATAGLNPRMVHVPDTTTAAELIAGGEAVTVCQPISQQRQGMVIRPLRDDPLAVRLLLACRSDSRLEAEVGGLRADLMASYAEAAWASAAYRWWLLRHGSPLLRQPGALLPPPGEEPPGAAPDDDPAAAGGLPAGPPEHARAAAPDAYRARRPAAHITAAAPRAPQAHG
jgi:hypothetical protein